MILPRPLRLAVCTAALTLASLSPLRAAEPLSEADSKFMTLYDQVQKALVMNNLEGVKTAAHALPDGAGADVEKAKDIKAARTAFGPLSEKAIKIAANDPEYHVFNCPMVNKDWVQRSNKIANPYMGADMLTCGVEKKKP